MYGQRAGVLRRSRSRLEFVYASGLPIAEPLLSVALPVQERPLRSSAVHAFFNGLLPEGEARRMLAYDFGQLDPNDVLAMLGALGRDCAGALIILPEDETPNTVGLPEAIAENDIAARLRRLHIEPLGADGRVRVSLAGMQSKLLLARLDEGWGLPIDGAPSTHILKPPTALLDHSVTIEGFCLEVAAALDIPAARATVEIFDSIPALVIERYDRIVGAEEVIRVHQEDLCQAHGIEPERKYEERGGPSLRQCAQVISDWCRPDDLWRLAELTTLNVGLGNADAHAKNISLLHEPDGAIHLAPAYDLLTTLHDSRVSTSMGMFVAGQSDLTQVTRDDLIAEITSWGLPTTEVRHRIDEIIQRLPGAVETAATQIRPPESVLAAIAEQHRRLR